MEFSLDYCCDQIAKRRSEPLTDQLRRLAEESLKRRGSHGNTCRLLRVIAARIERDRASAPLYTDLESMSFAGKPE